MRLNTSLLSLKHLTSQFVIFGLIYEITCSSTLIGATVKGVKKEIQFAQDFSHLFLLLRRSCDQSDSNLRLIVN